MLCVCIFPGSEQFFIQQNFIEHLLSSWYYSRWDWFNCFESHNLEIWSWTGLGIHNFRPLIKSCLLSGPEKQTCKRKREKKRSFCSRSKKDTMPLIALLNLIQLLRTLLCFYIDLYVQNSESGLFVSFCASTWLGVMCSMNPKEICHLIEPPQC